jgi:hypothetical protein
MVSHADVAQLVERQLPKLEVAGSKPVVRSLYPPFLPKISPVFGLLLPRILRISHLAGS